ncbi:hypothetical protein DL764_010857 [Monosporascus ibericus]|uniref:Uncharacterized protein n=1 Tax=Monosporascus ibericus TaxID=155417 RepID=A0A4Q4SS01_9PEZI|nr:hypothetical protein DL764_010857 [Monosporascus ibericus]
MTSSPREESPEIAEIEAETLQWIEEWNTIRSEYNDRKDSELSHFQKENQSDENKIQKLQEEIQKLQESIQNRKHAFDNAAKERDRAHRRRLTEHLKIRPDYMVSLVQEAFPRHQLEHKTGQGSEKKRPSSGVVQRIRPRPEEGYEDVGRQPIPLNQRELGGQSMRWLLPSATVSQRQHTSSDSIIDPTVGNVYRAYWKPSETWYAAVVLPTGDFDSIGMLGSLTDTGLLKYIPVCYCFDKSTRKITGWQKGYETGGLHATKRKFPVMYFDDTLTIPLRGDFKFPQRDLFDWVPAKFLRSFDFNDPESSLIPGYKSACDFRARMEARKEQQAQLGSMLIDGGDRTRDGQSTELTSSSSDNNRRIQQPNTETISRGEARSASAEPRAAQAITAASIDREMVDIYAIPDDNIKSHAGSESPSLDIEDSFMPAEGQRTGVDQSINNRGSDQAVNTYSYTARGACPDTARAEALEAPERTQQTPEPVQGFLASPRSSQASTASETGLIERQRTLRAVDGPRSSSESRSDDDGEGHYSNTYDDVKLEIETAPSDSASDIRLHVAEQTEKTLNVQASPLFNLTGEEAAIKPNADIANAAFRPQLEEMEPRTKIKKQVLGELANTLDSFLTYTRQTT